VQYIKESDTGDGYMNLFKFVKSPRLLVLNNGSNLKYIYDKSNQERQKIISETTGYQRKELNRKNRAYGCFYEDKPEPEFSRFSTRDSDAVLADIICEIPGIDGYIQPEVNYCGSGITYRYGKPYPLAKRFFGEVVLCNPPEFLERVGDKAIDCTKDKTRCDLTIDEWKKEFRNKTFDPDV
jgi:hypothetical protein